MQNIYYKLKDVIKSANTGLDAIQRAPIVNYKTKYKCLRIQDISQSKRFEDWGNTEVQTNYYNEFRLQKNDIIIARTGSTIGINTFIKYDVPAVFNNGLIRLRTNELVLPYYCYLFMQTKYFEEYINNISCGTSTQPNMKINDLLDVDFPYVDIKEQQHIVNTIGSLDDIIEKLNDLNKKLFDLGLKWIDIIDIKSDFKIYKLHEKLELLKDGTHNPPKRITSGIPLLTGQNIENGFIRHENITYISEEDYLKIHSKYAPREGDLLITKIGTLGKVALIRKVDLPITIHCNSALLRFNNVSPATAFFILNSSEFQREFHSHKNQTVQEFINLEQISNLNIKIPNQKYELIFNNIYQLISKNEIKIDKVKQIKQQYLKKFFG